MTRFIGLDRPAFAGLCIAGLALVLLIGPAFPAQAKEKEKQKKEKAAEVRQGSRFAAFGFVSGVDEKAMTIDITIDKADGPLKDSFGENITFHAARDLCIVACESGDDPENSIAQCWMKFGPKVLGTKGAGAALASLEKGKWISLEGFYDQASKEYRVSRIKIWTS